MQKHHAPRTDLAAEWAARPDDAPEGVAHDERQRGSVTVRSVEIRTEKAARMLGRAAGTYLTLETRPFSSPVRDLRQEAQALAAELRALLPREGMVLVVGLGNQDITPDALGPAAAEGVLVTRHLKNHLRELSGMEQLRSVCSAAPGVLGQTGFEAAELTSALTGFLHPSAVIAVDALAAAEPTRLGKTVQLSDTGIVPGSGVANHRAGLTAETLGVPVIAVGVPTVTEMPTGESTALVTPREIDVIIKNAAELLSLGISLALQPHLTVEEMLALM